LKLLALLRGFGIRSRDIPAPYVDHRLRRHHLRLACRYLWVDCWIASVGGNWIASADTPEGPSLGWGNTPREALTEALRPFEGIIDELLDSAPDV
jgi:hypothetical protein